MEPAPIRPVPARPAATVVLARDGVGGLEVLLLERHARSRMSPGAFAFPGGAVEASDAWADADHACRGLTAADAATRLADVDPPAAAVAYWIAALREAFEETGLLLAYGPDGAPLDPALAGSPRLAGHRARCRADAGAFRTMLTAGRLTLATDRMVYYGHWITPAERPVRYDARFFVAAAFPGAEAEPDGQEAVACRWIRPAAALAQQDAGRLTLPFPTRQTLGSMADQPDVATLLRTARGRMIRTIRPKIVRVDGEDRILLPGDPGYA